MLMYAQKFTDAFIKAFPQTKIWFDALSEDTTFIDVNGLLQLIDPKEVITFEPDVPETRCNFLTASKIGELYVATSDEKYTNGEWTRLINKFAGQLLAPKTLLAKTIEQNIDKFGFDKEYMTPSEIDKVWEQSGLDLHISAPLVSYRAYDAQLIIRNQH